MKQKYLRQLAKELEVAPGYLSQVKNGKRPASQKVLNKIGLTPPPIVATISIVGR